MLKFRCPSCQQKIGVDDSLAGRRVKCSACGKAIQVPVSTSDSSAGDGDPVSLKTLLTMERSAAPSPIRTVDVSPVEESGGPKAYSMLAAACGAGVLVIGIAIFVFLRTPTSSSPSVVEPRQNAAAQTPEQRPATVAEDRLSSPIPISTNPPPVSAQSTVAARSQSAESTEQKMRAMAVTAQQLIASGERAKAIVQLDELLAVGRGQPNQTEVIKKGIAWADTTRSDVVSQMSVQNPHAPKSAPVAKSPIGSPATGISADIRKSISSQLAQAKAQASDEMSQWRQPEAQQMDDQFRQAQQQRLQNRIRFLEGVEVTLRAIPQDDSKPPLVADLAELEIMQTAKNLKLDYAQGAIQVHNAAELRKVEELFLNEHGGHMIEVAGVAKPLSNPKPDPSASIRSNDPRMYPTADQGGGRGMYRSGGVLEGSPPTEDRDSIIPSPKAGAGAIGKVRLWVYPGSGDATGSPRPNFVVSCSTPPLERAGANQKQDEERFVYYPPDPADPKQALVLLAPARLKSSFPAWSAAGLPVSELGGQINVPPAATDNPQSALPIIYLELTPRFMAKPGNRTIAKIQNFENQGRDYSTKNRTIKSNAIVRSIRDRVVYVDWLGKVAGCEVQQQEN